MDVIEIPTLITIINELCSEEQYVLDNPTDYEYQDVEKCRSVLLFADKLKKELL